LPTAELQVEAVGHHEVPDKFMPAADQPRAAERGVVEQMGEPVLDRRFVKRNGVELVVLANQDKEGVDIDSRRSTESDRPILTLIHDRSPCV
jgi:hypothetical protein